MRTYLLRLKLEVLHHYGEVCKCCGESWPVFLSIDHVLGGGNAHRKAMVGTKSGGNIYWWLKKNNFPPGFQVLCHNCNMAKHFKKICPHKSTGATHATN